MYNIHKTLLEKYRALLAEGTLHLDVEQEIVIWELQRLHDELVRPRSGFLAKLIKPAPLRGVYIYGGVGRGKSTIMDLFFKTLPDDVKKRRVHFHQFMIEVHDFLHVQRNERDRDADRALPRMAAKLADNVRVLCFDEFHVTDVADAMILGRLFTALFERGVVVVATSNWAPDLLYEDGLQRERFLPFIKLLKDRCEVLHIDSPRDYRRQFLEQEGTYFKPFSPDTDAKIHKLFVHLTEGAPTKREQFEVKGRVIEVEEVAKGVARFSFSQLCERPHGAEDYIAIAKRYHTIFIERVPQMGYDRRNEAKRFMTLIDALYEASKKVIISADQEPDELYIGDDHAFEFQRTVSRLQEMQSKEYLER